MVNSKVKQPGLNTVEEIGRFAVEKRGLCANCRDDKGCGFTRKAPVLFCEEFGCEGAKPGKVKSSKNKVTIN